MFCSSTSIVSATNYLIDTTSHHRARSMTDVKELIPEFFFLPDFLVNSNEYKLGITQNRGAIGEVLLPPWANESPTEFVRVHRQALESEHVSNNLHNWIDLIFGFKQQVCAAKSVRVQFQALKSQYALRVS